MASRLLLVGILLRRLERLPKAEVRSQPAIFTNNSLEDSMLIYTTMHELWLSVTKPTLFYQYFHFVN